MRTVPTTCFAVNVGCALTVWAVITVPNAENVSNVSNIFVFVATDVTNVPR